MGYTLLSARAFGVLTDRHLNVSAYRARLEVRPALQRRCRRRERERVREAPSGVEAPPRSRSRHPTSPRMSSPSLTPTSSTSAAPTATRARATPSSTTSYTSSTTRARWRSSSTTAPSRLDVRAEAVRRLQGTATRARTARAGGRRSAGDGETPRAGRGASQLGAPSRSRHASSGRAPDNSEERRRRVRPPRLRRRDRVPALRQKWLGLLVGHHQRG